MMESNGKTALPPLPPAMADDPAVTTVWQQWQARLRLTRYQPRLVDHWLGQSRALLDRATRIYNHLCSQPRPTRRRLQRQLGASLAGVALTLALANVPVHANSFTANDATSLIAAINSANDEVNNPGPDTITLTGDVTLLTSNTTVYNDNTGLPLIISQITIEGAGHTITRDTGAPQFRLLAVSSSGDLTLNAVTLSGGNSSNLNGNGGAIHSRGKVTVSNSTLSGNTAANSGGAILNSGTLMVSNSTISGNTAGSSGGAIHNSGTLMVSNSTLSGNTASFSGGAINATGGTLTVSNSTLSGNTASTHGGAINAISGTTTVSNSTISGNTASFNGGAIFSEYSRVTVSNSTLTGNTAANGGAIHNLRTLTLNRSLIAGNTATTGAEISRSSTINANNYNLIGYGGNARSQNFTPGATDIVPSGALSTILNTSLADNGGPTLTHALVTDSPALDAAGDSGLDTDQRGATRPQGSADDIGAFELGGDIAVPEIDIQGNNVSLGSGDTTPSMGDGTDFGGVAVGSGTVVRTFTIQNTGTGALTLSGSPRVALSGTNATDFTVTTQPAASVAANSSTTFQITFDPSAVGVRTATVTIANNDSNEGAYTFAIQGTGTLPAPALSIPSTAQDASNGSFSVPVNFAGNGASIASVGFSLNYDESCLTFDATDGNSNGIPDAITGLPSGFVASISHDANDTAGELDISLFDNTTPIGTLSDGALLTLAFTVKPACITTDGSSRNVTLAFAATPAPSFGDPGAIDVTGTATGATIPLSFNATPTALNLSANTVDENAASGTTVGTLSTTDPDAGDSHSYTLVSGAGDTDNAGFTIVGNLLKTAASFDFESKSSLSVRLRTTDNGGLNGSFEQSFTISVNDLYEAPAGIDFGGSGANGGGDDGNPATLDINENATAGSTIATFGPANPDTGSSYTFALVNGEGSTDNGSFTFVGNELHITAPPDAEDQSSYTIRVRVTDDQGNSFEQVFTVTINDINEAPVAANDPDNLYAAIFVGGQTTTIDLLANDTDDDGDALTVASVDTTGAQGSVTNNSNNVSYNAPNSNGSSSFTYRASDGALTSNSATVNVNYVKNDLRGDCNANGTVTAADFIATVLEIFDDGDGQLNSNPAWWLVYLGGYAGSPRGCDANATENGAAHTSESVTVADITCTVLVFFGDTSCTVATATSADAASTATLSVPHGVVAQAGTTTSVAVTLDTAGNPVASAGFALVLDSSQVRFDPTDSDGDGVPDAIAIHAPASMTKSVRWNSALSRLEVALFGASLPLPTLSDGPLATVTLTVADNASGDSPLALQLVSLGNTSGDDVAVNGQDGSLHIGSAIGKTFLPFVQR